jgi:hypothetical protein
MSQRPFSIPLNKSAFISALHKGQGRALMHTRATGLGGIEDAIIDACLHDRSYDPQVDGDRSAWLVDLLESAPNGAKIASEIIRGLDAPVEEFWDACQRCHLARVYAERGNAEARDKLYKCLRKWPENGNIIGVEDIITLDGEEGLKRVAGFVGELLKTQPGFSWADWPIQFFDQGRENSIGRAVLEASKSSPNIARLLKHLDSPDAVKTDRTPPPQKSAAEVIREVESEDPLQNRSRLLGWARHASDEDLSAVFEAMIRETDIGRIQKYLRAFGRRTLRTWDDRLLSLADHADDELRRLAHRALSNYKHPKVRELAVQRIKAGRFLLDELLLLKLNYQPGDSALIEPRLVVPGDPHQLHWLGYDLIQIFKTNLCPEAAPSMLFVYDYSPCSQCRANAVRILRKIDRLPEWLIEEGRDDCSEGVRKIVAEPAPTDQKSKSHTP